MILISPAWVRQIDTRGDPEQMGFTRWMVELVIFLLLPELFLSCNPDRARLVISILITL